MKTNRVSVSRKSLPRLLSSARLWAPERTRSFLLYKNISRVKGLLPYLNPFSAGGALSGPCQRAVTILAVHYIWCDPLIRHALSGFSALVGDRCDC